MGPGVGARLVSAALLLSAAGDRDAAGGATAALALRHDDRCDSFNAGYRKGYTAGYRLGERWAELDQDMRQ